jgi:predicted nucleic acid-binding protein
MTLRTAPSQRCAKRGYVRRTEAADRPSGSGAALAEEAITALPQLVIIQVTTAQLVDRMWALRGNLTAYDVAYVATAEALDCPLVTGDGRLAKASGIRCEVRVL